jgi:hypothetical protein
MDGSSASEGGIAIEGKVNGMYQEEVCVYCAKLYGKKPIPTSRNR